MNQTDKEYFRLLELVLEKGRIKKNRTGVDTLGVFGAQARFNLQEEFPLLTTKKVFFKGIVHELLWFIKGDTNIKYLVDNNVHIWNEWAYAKYLKSPAQGYVYADVDTTKTKYHTPSVGMFDHLTQDEFIEKIKTDNDFAAKWGELGEGTYGGMWRNFPYAIEGDRKSYDEDGELCYGKGTVDQLKKVVDKLKSNPDDRRLLVSAWHPYWVDHCSLPPCHVLFQFHTEELTEEERLNLLPENIKRQVIAGKYDEPNSLVLDQYNIPKRRLNCQLYQRSADLGLGTPFNIASYSLLLMMMGQVVNMVPGEFIYTLGDLHIYENHIEALKKQMQLNSFKAPKVELNPEVTDLFKFKYDDIKLINYVSQPTIKMEVAV